MNSIVELLGRFDSMANDAIGGPLNLPRDKVLSCEKLKSLYRQLKNILEYSEQGALINGFLVMAICERVIPKSKRIKRLFSASSKPTSDDCIRGVKFIGKKHKKHVFIYFLKSEVLLGAINKLERLICVISCFPNEQITKEQLEKVVRPSKDDEGKIIESVRLTNFNLSKTEFCQLVCELVFVDEFKEYSGEHLNLAPTEPMLVQLIQTGRPLTDILNDIDVHVNPVSYDRETFFFGVNDLENLLRNAAYLVSMSVPEKYRCDKLTDCLLAGAAPDIPDPKDEAIIGVIDTAFDEVNSYFSKWVTYVDELGVQLDTDPVKRADALDHGTKVSSIIVDGPALNPDLDDGCGRFRVRHFRLLNAPGEASSIVTIIRKLSTIIEDNRDIRVWNFSFGSNDQIDDNYMSVIGAELDRLQYKYDVIFVISGSNKIGVNGDYKIGAPADSLNSIVVNSVNSKGEAASYSRIGPALSFHTKPDICYYGGDNEKKIIVCGANGLVGDQGTSFAAAWISRKLAFLICYMNLSREVAKALIIDSAAGWEFSETNKSIKGFGLVPIKIQDIINSSDDEIRFVVSGICQAYDTYTYRLPIPIVDSKYPYYARATLCYFPEGERWQGVDYTKTELDIHFGRLQKRIKKDSKTKQIRSCIGIKSINNNSQGEKLEGFQLEEESRLLYRKWDNVKRIAETIKDRRCPREILNEDNPQWGLSIRTKERLNTSRQHNLRFGVVVTLKEMFGKNRLNAFIKNCQALGWTVNTVDVDARLKFHIESNIEIEWDKT